MAKVSYLRASLILLIAGLISSCSLIDRIPPRNLTDADMYVCKRRILRYAKQNGKLPSSLNELPIIEGHTNSTKDAWGEPFQYQIQEGDIVLLESLGSDKKIGGEGDASDMLGRFPAKTKDGSWSDELVNWIQDPLK